MSRFLPVLGFDGIQAHASSTAHAIAAPFADSSLIITRSAGFFSSPARTQTPLLGRAPCLGS